MRGITLKYFLATVLIVNFIFMPVFAFEIDPTINDEIRRNYNPHKLEQDVGLPPLPKIINDSNNLDVNNYNQNPKKIEARLQQQKFIQNSPNKTYIVIKKGTRVKLKLLNSISDTSKRGTRLTFISTAPVSTTYFTIPTGSVFHGQVIKSHKPQFTGNGGLIEISINSVILDGNTQPILTSVTRANGKLIFFDNIKGNRKYVNSVFKSIKPGYRYCSQMIKLSVNLLGKGSSAFVSPFSLALGFLALGGNILVSPVIALIYKGDSIHFAQGSQFTVRLDQDCYIYN